MIGLTKIKDQRSIASNTQRVLSNDRHSPPEILGLNARIRIAFLVGLHEFGHSTARNARWEGSLESYHNCYNKTLKQ